MCDVGYVTSVPILIFLGLFVLDLGPMYTTDVRRQTDGRQKHRLMPQGIIISDSTSATTDRSKIECLLVCDVASCVAVL